jgi:hypothetical protein
MPSVQSKHLHVDGGSAVGASSFSRQGSPRSFQGDYFRPCIAMNAAHVRAEAAITTRSGFTVDLVAIASHPMVSTVRTASGGVGGWEGRPSEQGSLQRPRCPTRQGPSVTTVTNLELWGFVTTPLHRNASPTFQRTSSFVPLIDWGPFSGQALSIAGGNAAVPLREQRQTAPSPATASQAPRTTSPLAWAAVGVPGLEPAGGQRRRA